MTVKLGWIAEAEATLATLLVWAASLFGLAAKTPQLRSASSRWSGHRDSLRPISWGVVYALSAAAPCNNWSRSSRFITFPLAVNGSDGTNSICLGTFYPAMRVRQCATTWSFDNIA